MIEPSRRTDPDHRPPVGERHVGGKAAGAPAPPARSARSGVRVEEVGQCGLEPRSEPSRPADEEPQPHQERLVVELGHPCCRIQPAAARRAGCARPSPCGAGAPQRLAEDGGADLVPSSLLSGRDVVRRPGSSVHPPYRVATLFRITFHYRHRAPAPRAHAAHAPASGALARRGREAAGHGPPMSIMCPDVCPAIRVRPRRVFPAEPVPPAEPVL